MKFKSATMVVLASALAITPVASAHADGWRHGGGYEHGGYEHGGHERGGWGGHEGYHHDHDWGLFAGVAAITGAAVAVATLPFRAIEDVAAPPPPVYAPPAYYRGGYYAPVYPQQRVVVYGYPQPQPYPYPYATYAYPPE